MIYPYKWNLNDAVFTKDKGKVFSCFSCGGGSTMGYKLAGFDVIGCNEIDPRMMETYKVNHNPKYSFLEPIQTFKERGDFPDELYNLDILDGSPPCSSFSMAGSRKSGWGVEKKFREGQAEQVLDTLFFDFIELAKKLQPKVVIAENVKGLLLGEAIDYVRKIYTHFDDAGYYVQHFLLNSSTMGVPQKRERVFFIALRKDLSGPFMVQKDMFTEAPGIILEFKNPEIRFGEYREPIGCKEDVTKVRAALLESMIPGDKCISDINERLYNKVSGFNALLIGDDDVFPTITATENNYRKCDKLGVTKHEYCCAGTFPLDYNFLNNKPKYIIGMSVPPLMTTLVANEVYNQWLIHINKNQNDNQTKRTEPIS